MMRNLTVLLLLAYCSLFPIPCSLLYAQQVQGYPTIQVPNAPSGTQQGNLVKLDNTASGFRAVNAATTDIGGVLGIVIANAGAIGNVTVQVGGMAQCNFDGPTTAGDYVTISISAPGYCSDAGASIPSSQLIGRVRTTNAGSGTYQLELFTPTEISGGAQFLKAVTFTAGTPYTAGNISCLGVPSNTAGDCSLTNLNSVIGVNLASATGGLAVVIQAGLATVNSASSVKFVAGDVICASLGTAGTVIDNGAYSCPAGQPQIGIAAVSNSALSTTHTILVQVVQPTVTASAQQQPITPLFGIDTSPKSAPSVSLMPPCNAVMRLWCTVRTF